MLLRVAVLGMVLAACEGALVQEPLDAGAAGDGGFSGGDGGADAGAPDAGVDAGPVDAGTPDAGPPDAGPPDAGPGDGGPLGLDARPANPTCVAPAPPPGDAGVTTERAFPNLTFSQPLGLMQAPGDTTRIYVMERGGRVRAFPNRADAGASEVTTVLTLSGVNTSGEGGFLGMAFHPSWATRKELFVSYTETGSPGPLRSVIARYRSTDNGVTFDAQSEERLLVLDQPYSNHNGGFIAFGPDGFLYIGFGDGGSGGDPLNAGQRTNTILGKFLRIDVDVPASQRYAIPATNPYASSGVPCHVDGGQSPPSDAGAGCAEIYALGFRNPWRWSFDQLTGELWAGDVGQGAWEEIDKVELGGNYGWRFREGAHCHNPGSGCPTAGLIDPVVEYGRSEGNSITGGYVYRGSAVPSLTGQLIYGDYGSGRVWALDAPRDGGTATARLLQDTSISLASFGQTLDGEVFLLNIANGQVFRLVESTPGGTAFPRRLSQTGCFDAADPRRPLPALIPYGLGAQLWSDSAEKERYFAIPDGTRIGVAADGGDFDFPVGTVTVKTFYLQGKRVETRLLMRHDGGTWAGYSYEWNDAETEADLLPGGKTKAVGGQSWTYPSRPQCLTCHTAVAGRTLGPEVAQLNRELRYPATGRVANQLRTLDGLGFFTQSLPAPSTLPSLAVPDGGAPLEERARAYLHANCSGCHRQGAGQGPADFRFNIPLASMRVCNEPPTNGDLGLTDPRLIVPGNPGRSLVAHRMKALDGARMPPLGSAVVDTAGVALVEAWISSLSVCP